MLGNTLISVGSTLILNVTAVLYVERNTRTLYVFYRSRHGSVGIVDSLRAEGPKNLGSQVKIYFILQIQQTDFGAHPASCSMGGFGLFQEVP